jgi:hypothetical protein
MKIEGKCLCEAVQYAFEGELGGVTICHCIKCQKGHGAANASYGYFDDPTRFRWVRGEDHVRRYESAPGGERCFCDVCGSNMGYYLKGTMIGIPLGSVDGDPGVKPTAHVFTAFKAPWHEITDNLPQHEGFPPGMGDNTD